VMVASWGVCYLLLVSWILALWHTAERRRRPDGAGWRRRTLRSLWIFVPFLALVANGIVLEAIEGEFGKVSTSCEFDLAVLFGTILLVGVLTAAWTAWTDGRRWRLGWKLLAAPAAVALWVFLAWDGQTPRAGQRLWSGQEPLPAVRSWRHAAMLAWYDLWVKLPKAGGDDAVLWFWTDGRSEFGTRREDSPSARALRRRTDLPWTRGEAVFAVPLAPERHAALRDAMPFKAVSRHNGGYFLQTPEGLVQIRRGVVESRFPWPGYWGRDVHLAPGTRYWMALLSGKRVEEIRLRTVGGGEETGFREDDLPVGERIPVQVWVAPDTPFGVLADLLVKLDKAGFKEVFTERVPLQD